MRLYGDTALLYLNARGRVKCESRDARDVRINRRSEIILWVTDARRRPANATMAIILFANRSRSRAHRVQTRTKRPFRERVVTIICILFRTAIRHNIMKRYDHT